MAIESDGRFTPNATKGALELFSSTDMARAITKLDCGLTRDQVAQVASAYEQLFTPAMVRRSRSGLVRERLMKKVQDVFASARSMQATALACELVYQRALNVRDDDWSGLYVRVAIALGMTPDAAECAHAVVQLRREQGKGGEDARFASEQFDELWPKSDRAALNSAREFESVMRDVAKTCIAVAKKGVLEGFRTADERQRREEFRARDQQRTRSSIAQRQSLTRT